MLKENPPKPSPAKIARWRREFHVFMKAQASSFIGGLSDYAVMVGLTEWLHVFYPVSIVISGLFGAVINFSINRYWAFNQRSEDKTVQLKRFVFVVAGSIALKSSGTYLFTELLHFDYKLVRLGVDAVVSLGFNFMLMKYWVFRAVAD